MAWIPKRDFAEQDLHLGFRRSSEQHWAHLYNYVYRMVRHREEAEDIAQESFLRMAQDAAGAHLADDAARRWLFVVARNLCLDHLRRGARHPKASLDDCDEARSAAPNAAEASADKEWEMRIREAMDQLSPEMREALILREYEGMDYAQIAAVAECSLGTVKSRLARAREDMRRILEPFREKER